MTFSFVFTLILLLLLLLWLSRHQVSAADFYHAQQRPLWRHALAMSSDFVSVISLLGLFALAQYSQLHALLFALGFWAAWPLMRVLLARRLRRARASSVIEVLYARFTSRHLYRYWLLLILLVNCIYLISQWVAAIAIMRFSTGVTPSISLPLLAAAVLLYSWWQSGQTSARLQWLRACLIVTVLVLLLFGLPTFSPQPLAQLPALFEGFWPDINIALMLALGGCCLPHVLARLFASADAERAELTAQRAWWLLTVVYAVLATLLWFWRSSSDVFDNAAMLLQLTPSWLGQIVAAIALVLIIVSSHNLLHQAAASISREGYRQLERYGRASAQDEWRIYRYGQAALVTLVMLAAFYWQDFSIAHLVSIAFMLCALSWFPLLLLSLYWQPLSFHVALGVALFSLLLLPLLLLFFSIEQCWNWIPFGVVVNLLLMLLLSPLDRSRYQQLCQKRSLRFFAQLQRRRKPHAQ